jgi:hypothetical protein
MGKDRTTERSTVIPIKNKRTRSCNVIRTHLPCVRRESKNRKIPIDSFQLFVNYMLETVVNNLNKYIDIVSVNYSDHDKYKLKITSEIKACIGLIYMAGVFISSRQDLDDLWANDETDMEIFRPTMSQQRVRFLLQCLRFDYINRTARSEVDKLAPIRQFS